MAPPVTFGVTAEREVYLVKETVPGDIPASLGVPVPLTKFTPVNKPIWLDDESFQGSMGDMYGVYQGPLIGSVDLSGHVFGDHGLAEALYNLLGDYTATGSTPANSTTLTAAVAPGDTTASVTSGTGYAIGQAVQLDVSPTPEIVVLTAVSGTTLTFTGTPARFPHASAAAVATVVAPFTHVFALLNGSLGAANGPAQGPTHCFTDRQGIAANGAEQYAYGCCSEVTLTGNAEKLFDWSGKFVTASRQVAGSEVGTVNVSSVVPVPSWRTVTGWGGVAAGGTLIKTVAEHTITMSRAVKALNTEQGSQQPYIIARGKQSNSGKITISPAIDDSALIAMLANSQPQLQFITDNGLTGANQVTVTVDILLAALESADIKDGAELFGFDVSFKIPHTAASSGGITMTGASGGKGAVKVTLLNAVPTY